MRKFDLFQGFAPFGLIFFLAPSTALGQVVETSTIQNSFWYDLAGQQGSGFNSGGSEAIFERKTTETGISEVGLSLTGTLDNGSFFFLHNGQCVGNCSLTITTNINFTLFNSGPSPVDLRFDSQITPGHLANSFLNPGGGSQANFVFSIFQPPGFGQGALYRTSGSAAQSPPEVQTSDMSVFNGFNIQDNAPEWTVADWSATNISVNLRTLDPGQTTSLLYSSTLRISTSQVDCGNPQLCESFQVAFGDPRNTGGVMQAASLASFTSFLDGPLTIGQSPNPAVGSIYDPFQVFYRFVEVGSSPPPFPTSIIPPITYDVNYAGPTISAIPEPETWLLLVVGFGVLGGMMRRQRAPRASSA